MKEVRRMERNPAGLGHVYINTVDGSIAVLPLSTRKFDDWPLFSFLHEASPNTLLKAQSIRRAELRTAVIFRKRSEQNETGIFNYMHCVPIAKRYRPMSPIDTFLHVTTFVNANLDWLGILFTRYSVSLELINARAAHEIIFLRERNFAFLALSRNWFCLLRATLREFHLPRIKKRI